MSFDRPSCCRVIPHGEVGRSEEEKWGEVGRSGENWRELGSTGEIESGEKWGAVGRSGEVALCRCALNEFSFVLGQTAMSARLEYRRVCEQL